MKLKDASVFHQKKETGLQTGLINKTRWSDAALKGETWKEYPRPAMVRPDWINLNGLWDYAFTEVASGEEIPVLWDGKVRVPFSPEAMLSGVERQLQPKEYLWYQRTVEVTSMTPAQKAGGFHYLLHFGAVDQDCVVYLNGAAIGSHSGGYLPFTIDLGQPGDAFTLSVRVRDVSDTSYHSRGKQKLKRGGMYYTAQSGIWQTVWMELVPRYYIQEVFCAPDVDQEECVVTIKTNHPDRRCIKRKIKVPNPHLWSPEDPYLYPLTIEEGEDRIETYYAMRKLTMEQTPEGYLRFFLNGKSCIHTGVLDQGYWCDGLYTAPSDEALIYDIQTMKDMGFNMIRKHIKIEPQRWYYHCDRLGMLVWQDMVNGGRPYWDWFVTYLATVMNIRHISWPDGALTRCFFSRGDRAGRIAFLQEMEETVKLLRCHPSIVAWVPFNEGWGQFDAAKVARKLSKLDDTRYIDHASGWFDRKAGDMISIHHYFFGLHFKPEKARVLALSEFGGYSWEVPEHSYGHALYGYAVFTNENDLTDAYVKLYEAEVKANIPKGMSAFVYTQLSDVEDEANGLLTYDREVVKIRPEIVRGCNDFDGLF